ncbi:hypothetical protein [Mycobacteroides abscessus]|uniref:hypothetical protein n=1 Tax=Mycobacteroides abscessus TaxID=36809 RepID=UPI000C256AAB|nr:hypothetical protein [Mycobacteroides abscessus]
MATKATAKKTVPAVEVDDDVRKYEDNVDIAEGEQSTETPAKPEPKPGDAGFDWAPIYVEGTELKRYEDPSGTVVALPPFPTPDAGDIFADLLEDIPDHVMLIKLFRQAMRDHAVDYGEGIAAITAAFRGGGKLADIRGLLTFWSGAKLPN